MSNGFDPVIAWFKENLTGLIISGIAIFIGWVLYRLIIKQIDKYYDKDVDRKGNANVLKKIVKTIDYIVVISVVLAQFAESVSIITSTIAVMSATVIGFAAMNTLGNALAGIIIMISKPYQREDRIEIEGKMADVAAIEFMYTKIRYLNGTIMSIPNQEMLSSKLINYSKSGEIIGRSVIITLDYEAKPAPIMKDLIETVLRVDGVLQDPEPKCVISKFLDYAVEYSCFYNVSKVKEINPIDSKVRLEVLNMCQDKGYDLTMPLLHKGV